MHDFCGDALLFSIVVHFQSRERGVKEGADVERRRPYEAPGAEQIDTRGIPKGI